MSKMFQPGAFSTPSPSPLVRHRRPRRCCPKPGTFVVHDGKITRWHDYWDTGLPIKMMTGEDVAALIPSAY